jgi:hypothetical protein
MLIAFIIISVYAYAITGYLYQKAEYCEALDEKLIFGVLWPLWLLLYIYRFMYISMYKARRVARKTRASEEERARSSADQ